MKLFFDIDGVDVRDCHAIQGVMEGTTYNLWGMKELVYVMRMMATGGLLDAIKLCRMTSRRWNDGGVKVSRTYKYSCPFDWHFRYRHAVDDHNNLRHGLPSIEDSWRTNPNPNPPPSHLKWTHLPQHSSWIYARDRFHVMNADGGYVTLGNDDPQQNTLVPTALMHVGAHFDDVPDNALRAQRRQSESELPRTVLFQMIADGHWKRPTRLGTTGGG
jgi:hypothetical protein